MTWGQCAEALDELFEMPKPRALKCKTLYHLARASRPPGVIVELGTFHGNGAIALAFGTRDGAVLDVYTVDDYQMRKGWASEPYGPKDRQAYSDNVVASGVKPMPCLMQWDALALAQVWTSPITLLHWDLGMMARVAQDIKSWWPHIRPGGFVAIHDTADQKLGARYALDQLEDCAFVTVMPGGLWVGKRIGRGI